MGQAEATREGHPGNLLLGISGGMLVVAVALGGHYVLGNKSEARAATVPAAPVAPAASSADPAATSTSSTGALAELLEREVTIKTGAGTTTATWAALGVTVDPSELARSPVRNADDIAKLAATGSLPLQLDREKAVEALLEIKHGHDKSPINAHLDLEARVIHQDAPGHGLDVWASLPRVSAGARQGLPSIELVTVPIPATVTKATLGIDDISQVMGHYSTKFSVTDKDRNFNLKLAASKINGAVLKPGQEWSFNDSVGERSQRNGYKVAHVITAGEMVDGLAGGTCQISTTLFGAAFFAGIDITKTINHSRPSVYTPLGFDATVVWPDVDLKIKNPYEFPVAIHYRVTNGEAFVEILGKKRPFDKIEFERKVIEESPYPSEERLDETMPEGQTTLDQPGFNGYKLERYRRFYKKGKVVKTNKWVLNYKPVTEYIRRGTNPDPSLPPVKAKVPHGPVPPKSDTFKLAQ
ncbi:MAG: VanW family protein [Kofleriaceae bacterium]